MKLIDIADIARDRAARLTPGDLAEMARERERTSPEKERLIAEIVTLIFAGAGR